MPDTRPWFTLRTGGARELATHLAIAAAYALAAQLAFQVGSAQMIVASVWPPAGVALAVLLLFGPRWWPGILLGAVAANVMRGVSLPAAATIAVGNTLATLFGVLAIRRLGFFTSVFRVRD